LFLVLLAGWCRHGLAAAPANDTCATPAVIPGSGPFPYLSPVVDISEATISGDPPIAEDFYKTRVIRSVWYTFTPAVNAVYTLSTCAGAGATTTTADTVMALYTSAAGCNGPFAPEGSLDDETCSPQATLTRQLLADTQYYLVIWKFCDGCPEDGRNAVQVHVTRTIPPPNDTCATALPVQLNLPLLGTTVGARNDYQVTGTNAFAGIDQLPSLAAGREVVYSFTASEAGEYSFRAFNYAASQDVLIYLASTCPAGQPGATNQLTPLAAANRAVVNTAEEILCLPMTAGQRVLVFIDDHQGGNAGSDFTLAVTQCQRENERDRPNNSPADATPLACGIEGSLTPAGDRDFYRLGSFPAGWRAFAMVDGEAAQNSDFDLRITTFSDTVEYDDDNNDHSFATSSPNLSGTYLTGSQSFLVVDYKIPRESEPYRLYAVVQPPLADAAAEAEPNDTLAEASSAEQNYFYGTLAGPAPSTDADVYAFGVAEGDLIFIGLDGDPHRTNAPVNAKLELLDAAGTSLVTVNDSAFSSVGGTNLNLDTLFGVTPAAPGEALVYRVPLNTETLFARVTASPTASASSGAGAYLLSISRNCLIGSEGFNHAPTLSNALVSTPVVVGIPATLRGTIWELDAIDDVTLLVNWGDGTSNRFDYPPGRTEFAVTHTFTSVASNLNVTLSVHDPSGAGNGNVTVPVRVRPVIQAARFLSIQSLSNGPVRLEVEGTPAVEYRIEWSTTMTSWSTLGTRTANGAGRFTIDDAGPMAVTRFYRAVGE
jgi:hypothetical protein